MKTAVFVAILLLPASALAGRDPIIVPDRFVGQWAGGLQILADLTQTI